MAECLALTASGKVHADIELVRLGSINAVLDRLAHDRIPARAVIDFAPLTTGAAQPELAVAAR
jgi:D-arabinose 1-dehydrogenase-like Zn-dependent alcohol dehydrogenase